MSNGGTLYQRELLFASPGRSNALSLPLKTSNLVLVELNSPYNATAALDKSSGDHSATRTIDIPYGHTLRYLVIKLIHYHFRVSIDSSPHPYASIQEDRLQWVH